MREFYQQRYNLLLCTTIIETGIDVPTANTIIMQRADKLGLAQLHQLRRPRRPKPPSGLRLPAHPAIGRHDEAGEAAPRSHPVP